METFLSANTKPVWLIESFRLTTGKIKSHTTTINGTFLNPPFKIRKKCIHFMIYNLKCSRSNEMAFKTQHLIPSHPNIFQKIFFNCSSVLFSKVRFFLIKIRIQYIMYFGLINWKHSHECSLELQTYWHLINWDASL